MTDPVEWIKGHKPAAIGIAAVGGALAFALYKRSTANTGAATTTAGIPTSTPGYATTTDGTVLSWQSPQGLFNSGGGGTAADLGLPAAVGSVASPQAVGPPPISTAPMFQTPSLAGALPGEKFVANAYTPDHLGEYFLTNYGGVYGAGNAPAGSAGQYGSGSYLGLNKTAQQGDPSPGTPSSTRQFGSTGLQVTPTGYIETDTNGEAYAFQTA